jgi:hypothetical protein
MPPPREFADSSKWTLASLLGPPDYIIPIPEPFVVEANAPNLWIDLIAESGLKEDRWVRAFETKPSPEGFPVVHHAVCPNTRRGLKGSCATIRHKIVLVHSIAAHSQSTHQHSIPIEGQRAGEEHDSVLIGIGELRADGRLRTYTIVAGTCYYDGHQFPEDARLDFPTLQGSVLVMALIVIAINLVFSFTTRDDLRSVFSLDTFSDRMFVIASLASATSIIVATELGFLQRILDTVELTGNQWLICIGAGVPIVVVSEIRKFLLRRRDSAAP